MRKQRVWLIASVVLVAVGAFVTRSALGEEGQKYRVVRTNGTELVGEVTELPNAYQIKVASGIIVTLRKSEVRELIPVEQQQPVASQQPGTLPVWITNEEIEEILGSENIEIAALDHIERIDLMDPLPRNEEHVREMLRIAGRQARIFETDHFVLVYTSSIAKARKLGSRLEAVYRWRVWFLEQMGIEPVRPDAKLEAYFFGTHEEFQGYQALHGDISMGVLGFWHPVDNRSVFFDTETWPPIANLLKRYSDPKVDFQIRRRGRNMVERWVEYQNMSTTQHEAGHHIDFNIGIFPKQGDVPRWLVEGLTMQFEAPPSELGGCLGRINYKRLQEIRQQYGPNLEALPMMRDFMLHDALWFQGYNYPLGWALVHYLYKQNREAFAKFMRLMAQREDDWGVRVPLTEKLKQMEEIFGEIDEEWTQQFKDYISSIPMRESQLPPRFEDFP